MEERKFKTNDYVVVKNWDELVEEYGLVDPESVREQMRIVIGQKKRLMNTIQKSLMFHGEQEKQ